MSAPKIRDNWEEQFRLLEKDWDSYGGDPPTEAAIASAKLFIQNIQNAYIIPTSNGGLSLSWFVTGIGYNDGSNLSAEISVAFDENGFYEME